VSRPNVVAAPSLSFGEEVVDVNLSVEFVNSSTGYRYEPNAAAQRFHQSPALYRAFIGGIRGGKTAAGSIETVKYALLRPNSVGGIIAPTYPMLMDSTLAEFERWLPRGILAKDPTYSPHPCYTFVNGTVLHGRSAERPDALRGPTWSFAWGDEFALLRSDSAWTVMQGRVLSTKGRLWVTTTPKGRNWIYDRFVSDDRKAKSHTAVFQAATAENTHLDAEQIAILRSSYSDLLAAQELDAVFVEGWDGLVYPTFRLDVHVSATPLPFNPKRPLWLGVDWGMVNPTVVLPFQMTTTGQVHCLGELRITGHEASATSRMTQEWLRERGWWQDGKRLPEVYRDKSGAQETAEWRKQGWPILGGGDKAGRSVKTGIDRCRQLLQPLVTKDGQDLGPGMLFDPSCKGTIDELTRYQWAGRGDEVLKEYDHGPDAWRYFVTGNWFKLGRHTAEQVRGKAA
jgi:hypothetical protein